jgi:hypothetical protein
MEALEGIDWEGLQEFIEPLMGLIIALGFMLVVRLLRSSSRRQRARRSETPPVTHPSVKTPRLTMPKRSYSVGAAPIEPGDDAAKLSERYSHKQST